MQPYDVVATGFQVFHLYPVVAYMLQSGMIEVVLKSDTTANINEVTRPLLPPTLTLCDRKQGGC
jgi:hypothetical protein